jgi:hypothetical protein
MVRRVSARPALTAAVLVALGATSCSLFTPAQPELMNPPSAPAPQQQAAVPPPRPAVRTPPPVESVDPKQLDGLNAEEVRNLLGAPDRVREAPPATVWTYASSACLLEVYFYMDLGSQKLRVLAHDISAIGRANDQRAINSCASQIRAESRDGKR